TATPIVEIDPGCGGRYRHRLLRKPTARLLPALPRQRRRDTETDEECAADVALEAKIGPVPLQPVASRPSCECVASIGDQPEAGEEEAEDGDLRRHVAAADLDELGQEREKEQGCLRIEEVDDEAVAEQPEAAEPRRHLHFIG